MEEVVFDEVSEEMLERFRKEMAEVIIKKIEAKLRSRELLSSDSEKDIDGKLRIK